MQIKNQFKCLEIDGRQQIILTDSEKIYLVKKGKVFLHFAEIDEQGINKRKHFIEIFEPNQVFSGCSKEYNGKKYALIASGESESQVFEFMARQIKLEDPSVKEDILRKINTFYSKIIEETQEIKELETIDEKIIEQNNGIVLDRIKNNNEKKENQEMIESQKREQKNREYSKKNLNSILKIFGKKSKSNSYQCKFNIVSGK